MAAMFIGLQDFAAELDAAIADERTRAGNKPSDAALEALIPAIA
jgi:hypothetical protein